MNYISTRNKSLNFDFSSIFLRGLAPDGGLFLPNEIQKFNEKELNVLSKLNYIDLGVEIISKFCSPVLNKNKIKLILDKAYSCLQCRNRYKNCIIFINAYSCTLLRKNTNYSKIK